MGIATEVEIAIDQLLASSLNGKSAALCTALVPVAITGATIYLILMGFTIMRGEANDSFQTFLWKSVRMAFVGGLALSAGTYQATIVDGSTAIEIAFIETMSGTTSVGALIDNLNQPFMDLGTQLWNEAVTAMWPNLGLVAAAVGVAIAEFFLFAIALGLYLLAKIALALVLAIGSAFVLCAMWPATEKYTESWLGQVLNFVILKVLIALSIVTLTSFASQFAAHIVATSDSLNVLKATTALLLCSGALVVVMLNLPQLASALAGGASISGIGRTIGRAGLDLLNKTGGKKAAPPEGGSIKPDRERGQGTGPLPPPRQPLYNRNTIERIRQAS